MGVDSGLSKSFSVNYSAIYHYLKSQEQAFIMKSTGSHSMSNDVNKTRTQSDHSLTIFITIVCDVSQHILVFLRDLDRTIKGEFHYHKEHQD